MTNKQRLGDIELRLTALENPPRYIEHLGAVPMRQTEEVPTWSISDDAVPVFDIIGILIIMVPTCIGFGLGILWSML